MRLRARFPLGDPGYIGAFTRAIGRLSTVDSQTDSALGPPRDRESVFLAMPPSARASATRSSTQSTKSEWLIVDKHLAAEESSLRGRVGAPIRWDAHQRGSARTRAVILGGPNDAEVGTVPERIAQAHRDRAPKPNASHAALIASFDGVVDTSDLTFAAAERSSPPPAPSVEPAAPYSVVVCPCRVREGTGVFEEFHQDLHQKLGPQHLNR